MAHLGERRAHRIPMCFPRATAFKGLLLILLQAGYAIARDLCERIMDRGLELRPHAPGRLSFTLCLLETLCSLRFMILPDPVGGSDSSRIYAYHMLTSVEIRKNRVEPYFKFRGDSYLLILCVGQS